MNMKQTFVILLLLLPVTFANVNITLCLNDFSNTSTVYQWFSSHKWSWGIIPRPKKNSNTNPTDIARITNNDNMHIILQLLANIESQQRNDAPSPSQVLNLYISSTNKPQNIHWEAYIEDDSCGIGFPYDLLLITSEDQSLYTRSYDISYNKWTQYLQTTNDIIQVINNNITIYAQSGFASSTHYYASPDFGNTDCIMLERANDDIGDLQTGIAFTRGAAKQYGKKWGIDLSIWWGVISGCIQNLVSQSYHKRHLYISYLSGANIINIEGGDLLFNGNIPSILATIIEEFGNFTLEYPDLEEQYKTDIPISVLLAPDNGYITPLYWSTASFNWNYAKITPRVGDDSIGAFFSTAFPASNYYQDPFPFGNFQSNDPPASPFALSSISAQYSPDGNTAEFEYYAESYIPFGEYYNRTDARNDMMENKIDPSPYRTMGDSRWGDIFDVFVLDQYLMKNDILSNYPMLLMLGAINISYDGMYYKMLYEYVNNGGVLVWSVGIAKPEHMELIGVNITGNILTGRYWKWMEDDIVMEAFRYVPVENVDDNYNTNVSVIASIPSNNGKLKPLIIENSVGNGKVYTSLIPWFTASMQYQLSNLCLKLFDYLMENNQYQKVFIDANKSTFGTLQWLTSTSIDGKTKNILLTNNDENTWNGNILLKTSNHYSQCKELLTQKILRVTATKSTFNISLTIPKYDVRIIQCQ